MLRPEEKTALLFPVDAAAAGQPAAPGIDAEVKPTGRKRDIDGVSCDEFSVMMKLDMACDGGRRRRRSRRKRPPC